MVAFDLLNTAYGRISFNKLYGILLFYLGSATVQRSKLKSFCSRWHFILPVDSHSPCHGVWHCFILCCNLFLSSGVAFYSPILFSLSILPVMGCGIVLFSNRINLITCHPVRDPCVHESLWTCSEHIPLTSILSCV